MVPNFWLLKLKPSNAFLILLLIIIISCGKKQDFKQSTDLNLTISFHDNYWLDDYAVGANVLVKLYKSRVDMEARLKPVASVTTDSKGNVLFNGLEPFS